jgi:hypothetical protein
MIGIDSAMSGYTLRHLEHYGFHYAKVQDHPLPSTPCTPTRQQMDNMLSTKHAIQNEGDRTRKDIHKLRTCLAPHFIICKCNGTTLTPAFYL